MLLTARNMAKVLQLTLAVIKPDAVAHPLMLEVLTSSLPYISIWGLLLTIFKARLYWSRGFYKRVVWSKHIANK